MNRAERIATWALYLIGAAACVLIVGGWLLGMSRAGW